MLKNLSFCTVVLQKTLERVPWSARRSNQSILKEVNPDYSLEGLMLKFQYFGHLMQRADSLAKTLVTERPTAEGGDNRIRWWDSVTESMNMGLSKLGELTDREVWRSAHHEVAKSRRRLRNSW